MQREILGSLFLLLTAAPAVAQTVPTVTLTRPDATFAEPFSAILGLRELPDGDVLVSDRLEQALRILDFQTGTMRDVGRQGRGPTEFGMPGFLFPWRGDSTLLLDFGNFRGLLLSGDGSVGRTVPLAREGGLPFLPAGSDTAGRLYSASPTSMEDGVDPSAGTPIVRWDPGSGATDTIATLDAGSGAGAGLAAVRLRGGGSFFMAQPGPYAPEDAFAVSPDGRVGVVRAADYHVEWVDRAGHTTVGQPTPYDPVRVGRAEKAEWADQRAAAVMTMSTPQGSRTIRAERPEIDEQEWPEYKPPFDPRNVYAPPGGELWVHQSSRAGDHPSVFDVFDRHGRLVRRVAFPPGRRIVGFGDGTAYAVRLDADDLQWLERYRVD